MNRLQQLPGNFIKQFLDLSPKSVDWNKFRFATQKSDTSSVHITVDFRLLSKENSGL